MGMYYNIYWVWIFWRMLINGTPNVLFRANQYGEFWFEFLFFNSTLILTYLFMIKLIIERFKKKRLKRIKRGKIA